MPASMSRYPGTAEEKMVTCLRATRIRQLHAAATVSLPSLLVPAGSAPAQDPTAGAQEIGSRSAGSPSERPDSAKGPRKPLRKPDGAGHFVHEIINNIRAQSQEFCARYGNPADCLEQAEVCLTMRDTEDNRVRLCLTTIPGERASDVGKVHSSRVRR
jgi:hypothetical protein